MQFDLGQDFVLAVFDRKEERVLGGTGLHVRSGPLSREIGLEIHCAPDNERSARVPQKLGFQREAVLARRSDRDGRDPSRSSVSQFRRASEIFR
ncbi:GNAT family N-acetyltransferase [Archangium violaceum]|uniref:GNAT family N-acetyltransferase n=1 Tax=Archangium violaceum TaxID=83451 RepID=UPI00195257B9|nr:GNAT family N-acetyltransferase [Archangium violaceum]QRO00618.1 GNAT family N-acetyltransferase [Archangium violaceum]